MKLLLRLRLLIYSLCHRLRNRAFSHLLLGCPGDQGFPLLMAESKVPEFLMVSKTVPSDASNRDKGIGYKEHLMCSRLQESCKLIA